MADKTIPIPLDVAVESLWTPGVDPARPVKLLKTVLNNVINNPNEPKFRSLNSAKLIPKLAAQSLAPLYIIQHAGFVPGPVNLKLVWRFSPNS